MTLLEVTPARQLVMATKISTGLALNLNKERTQFWAKNADKIALLRDQGTWLAREHLKGRKHLFGRCHVQVWLAFPDRIERDSSNWYPTAKAMVDGFTDAKMWPNDNDKWVVGPHLWPADRLGAKRVVEMRFLLTEIPPQPEF